MPLFAAPLLLTIILIASTRAHAPAFALVPAVLPLPFGPASAPRTAARTAGAGRVVLLRFLGESRFCFSGILLGTFVLQKLVTDRLFDCLAEDALDLDEVAQPQLWVHLGVFTIIFDQFRVEAFALVDTEWPILAPNRRFFDLNPSNQQRFHNFLFQTEAASNAFVLTFLPEFFLVVLRKLRETRWRPRAEQSSELRPFHVAFGATPTPSAFAAQPATDWVGLCFAAVADDPWTHG